MLRRALVVSVILASARAYARDVDYKAVYAHAAPAVVVIFAQNREGESGSMGSGSIIRPDGLVVTNAHVILNEETKAPYANLFVFLKPDAVTGKEQDDLKRGYQAQWLVYSPELDLALLRIVKPPKPLPVLEISDDSTVGVGEATAAIGHPGQGAKWSLTTGRIGGEWSDFDGVRGKDVYQMETSINPGNSGGPLLDGNGRMIGINTSIARQNESGLALTGLNFAIKSRVLRSWIEHANEGAVAAPDLRPRDLPAPRTVAEARPAPPALSVPVLKGALAKKEAVTATVPPPPPSARRVAVSLSVPPSAPPLPRGFTSRERPGTVKRATELTAQHADDAFKELDRRIDDEFGR